MFYKPDYRDQITLFALEVFQELCVAFGTFDCSPAVLRRNVLIEGGDLNAFIGQRFALQDVQIPWHRRVSALLLDGSRLPPRRRGLLRGQGGLRARIVSDWLSVES